MKTRVRLSFHLILAFAAMLTMGQTAMAETVTYTISGNTENNGNVNFSVSASGDATGNAGTSWSYAGASASDNVSVPGGIIMSFGSDKTSSMAVNGYLQIEANGSTGGSFILYHGSKFIYHITMKDNSGNVIHEAWNMSNSYNHHFQTIRLKTIVVDYATSIPFTDAVISGLNSQYVVSATAVTPTPTVKWHGTTLTSGTHYTVSYADNTAAGTATVTATGKGIFSSGTSVSATYTLRWSTYYVRFYANGGSGEMSNQDFTYGTAQALTANGFTRTGYTFDGWNTAADGNGTSYTDGQSVSNLTATNGGTVDLYAQWTPIAYTLRLHHNDGTDDYTDMTLTYDEAQNIQSISRTGYIFDGWSTTQDGSIAYTDGQEVLNLTAENGATIDLYAQWTLITNWSHVNTALKTDGAVVTLPDDITAGDGDSYLLVPSGVTATLDLNGHTINRNLTSNGWEGGSAIRVEGSLTINDSQGGGCITGGNGYKGGGVCVMRNASFTMNGGTISGNTACEYGGGVMVYSDATCTLNGVTISGNTASNGGGVYVDYSSSCSMTDVTITGNTASSDGGGVCAYGRTTFSGLCTITGNTKGGQNNNVYAGSRLYIGGTLDPATRIGINVNRSNQQRVITNGLNGKGSLDNFFCDVEGDQLSLNDDGEAVMTLPPVKVCIYRYGSSVAGFRVTDETGNEYEHSGDDFYAFSGTTVYVHIIPREGKGISSVTYSVKDGESTPATLVSAEQGEFVFTFAVPYTTSNYGIKVNVASFNLTNGMPIYDDKDNLLTIASYDGLVVGALLWNRTLYKDGDWNTLCLPFNVSDLSGTCLEGATLMELGNSNGCNTGFDATTGTLTLDFVPATSIKAGHAYLVKWETKGDPIGVPTFIDVTVDNKNPENQKVVSQDGSVTFVGSYCPVTFTGGDRSVLFLGSNNSLYFPAADRTMGSCRAYFRLNLNAASEVKAFVLNFNEDDADGINSLTPDPSPRRGEEWYTLDGRKLNGKPTKGGIYIHNGRKEILK